MKSLQVIFSGQKDFGLQAMSVVRDCGHEIVQVAAPLADVVAGEARRLGLPIADPTRGLDSRLVLADADIIVAIWAHWMIHPDALAATRLGGLAYHPSLLPRHRGKDAIRWTLRMHEPIAGGTVFWLSDVVDGGPIAAQDWCHVRPGDTPAELWRRDLARWGSGFCGQP